MALIFGKSADPVVNWIVIECQLPLQEGFINRGESCPAAATISKS